MFTTFVMPSLPRRLCVFLGLILLALSTSISLSHADERPLLRVFTYGSMTSDWGPGPALKARFEAECQCRVEYNSSEDGVSLLNRLRLEGQRTRADVILGLDTGLIPEAERLGLTQPHQLALESFRLQDNLAWDHPHFIPFDQGYFAFVYHRQRTPHPVTSLEALLNSDARIIYQDPRTSTPGLGLLIWIQQVYGDQAPEAWRRLAERTVTVTSGWSDAYSLFLAGEADYVLSYSTSPAYHWLEEQDFNYQAVLMEEGHPRQIEVAAISRWSQNPDLARDFLAFLLSPSTQAELPLGNWMLPVIDDVALPDAFEALIQPEPLLITPEELDRQRSRWIRIWRTAVSR
ncbi:thiamine ABC transporter substrate binding subunit [Marinospirillum sp.]|uniref:thiamine ABC transporter substrate binding subunit n=1 Tax=Marinospirillum sp. TaxID=2183934 RepID=UPI003A8A70B4